MSFSAFWAFLFSRSKKVLKETKAAKEICRFTDVVTMLRCYGIDIVFLYDDRVGAIFSPIIDKISNSRGLTKLRPSDVNVTSP